MLRTQVRCRAVLALTATATSSTAAAVAAVLDIPQRASSEMTASAAISACQCPIPTAVRALMQSYCEN